MCLAAAFMLTACERSASVLRGGAESGNRVNYSATPLQATLSATEESAFAPNTPTPLLPTSTKSIASEYPVVPIPLSGPITSASAEISGMAWLDNETLILLPQYPEKFGEHSQGAVFAIQKAQILEHLQGESNTAIQPSTIPFNTAGLSASIPGYEGFESIAISRNSVYLTIESRPGEMMGYVVSGRISSASDRIDLEPSLLTPIPPQTSLKNYSDEALLVFGSRLVSIYEINGAALNPHPAAHLFDLSLQLQDSLAFPSLEYRITDATPADETGRFWAINYFYPGDHDLRPMSDPVLARVGEGSSHARSEAVERLIELQFSEAGIVLSDSPPIQLELLPGDKPRNWEAISRLEGVGFLLASDRYPGTTLGFVQYP